MKITFDGAARTVTGSRHVVEANGRRIMLDCGLFQGKRKEAFELNRRSSRRGDGIDVIVLSHAHIDHSGNIPTMVRNGFSGDIVCTAATRDLCAIMLMDSAHIQEKDVEFVNELRAEQGKNLFEPLYTQNDVITAMKQFVGVSYGRRRPILPGIDLTLVDAGHMLGSSSVILDIDDRDSGKTVRLVFSGDIGRPDIPIIEDPVPVEEGADILLMESTYGNRHHPPYPEAEEELRRIVTETHGRGGFLLIPAFAVGRTQQIVYALHRLHNENRIPDVPVYVDSPLATRATEVFRLHPETYDAEIRAFLMNDDDRNPFGFSSLRYTRSVEESKELNTMKNPAVIISASGMMEGGRILHHLRHRVPDERNTVLITGWQAPHTLGRKLVEGEKTVRIYGREHEVRARVEVLTGLSGHADREGLLAWAGAMKKKPRRTFVIHGEEKSAREFAASLETELGFDGIEIPAMNQTVDLD